MRKEEGRTLNAVGKSAGRKPNTVTSLAAQFINVHLSKFTFTMDKKEFSSFSIKLEACLVFGEKEKRPEYLEFEYLRKDSLSVRGLEGTFVVRQSTCTSGLWYISRWTTKAALILIVLCQCPGLKRRILICRTSACSLDVLELEGTFGGKAVEMSHCTYILDIELEIN